MIKLHLKEQILNHLNKTKQMILKDNRLILGVETWISNHYNATYNFGINIIVIYDICYLRISLFGFTLL